MCEFYERKTDGCHSHGAMALLLSRTRGKRLKWSYTDCPSVCKKKEEEEEAAAAAQMREI
jgi:hypothetical protein